MEVTKDNLFNIDNISNAITNESVAQTNDTQVLIPPSAPRLKPKMPLFEFQSFVLPLSANAASQSAYSTVDDNSLMMNTSNFGLHRSNSFTPVATELSSQTQKLTQVTLMNDNSSYQQIFEALKQQ